MSPLVGADVDDRRRQEPAPQRRRDCWVVKAARGAGVAAAGVTDARASTPLGDRIALGPRLRRPGLRLGTLEAPPSSTSPDRIRDLASTSGRVL